MKFVIASDIHGSEKYCRLLIEAFRREGADKLLLLGDILYHGPRNPLPEEYAPKKVVEMLSEIRHKIICVRGNCDAEIDCEILPFPVPDYACVVADGLNIYMSHGHRAVPPLTHGDIYLTGHTHVPLKQTGEYVHLNPGSVSLPKEDSRHGIYPLRKPQIYFQGYQRRTVRQLRAFRRAVGGETGSRKPAPKTCKKEDIKKKTLSQMRKGFLFVKC